MFQDITDKKKLEEPLEELIFEFFENLYHEIRTPINLIMSAMQVVNLKLVNNLIDTTKIDLGSFDYSSSNQDIISFVEIHGGYINLKII
ncbi:MAG: hypothetical protein ACRDD7_06925 [Peptostreptococcaceae bacterium]